MRDRPFLVAVAAATALQLAMVLVGHWSLPVQNFYAPGGLGFSLLGAALWSIPARPHFLRALAVGALVGGLSGFVGVIAAFLLGDVEVSLLIFVPPGSAFVGLVGGAIGCVMGRPKTPA